MAQVRPIKIDATTGLFIEIDTSADDLTMNTFTVDGVGIVLGQSGLALNSAAISGAGDIHFQDPTTYGIVQTSGGTLTADDIVGKDRPNTFTTGASILLPTVADSASSLSVFRMPTLAGTPTATPGSGEGTEVWDSTNNILYIWDGSQWVNMNNATTIAPSYVAQTGINAGVAVYITSACQILPASADAESSARVIGFTQNSAGSGVSVGVIAVGQVSNQSFGTNIGSRIFLGTATAALSTSPPTDADHQIVQVGYAANSTTLNVQIIPLAIRRA